MKFCSTLLAIGLLCSTARASGWIRPTPTPPAPPVVTDTIPALPPHSQITLAVTLTDGSGLLTPFLGSKGEGWVDIDSKAKTAKGELVGAKDATGKPLDVTPGKYKFNGAPVTISSDNKTITWRTVRDWGVVEVLATRTDSSNVHVIITGTLQGSPAVAVGSGFLVAIEPPPVVVPDPDPVEPDPVDHEPQDGDILTDAQWWAGSQHEREAGAFKVVSPLKVDGFRGDVGRFLFNPFNTPCVLALHRYHNGVLVGGPIDGIDRDGDATKTVKNYLYARRHGPGTEAQDAAALTPAKGETVYWSIVSVEKRERTAPCAYPFPLETKKAEVEDDAGPINKGGDGLYKPESSLWLLPQKVRAEQIRWAGEVDPTTQAIVRFHKWPQGGFVLDSRKIDGSTVAWDGVPQGYYHNNRLKLRDAKATRAGAIFRVGGLNNQVLAEMTVINPGVRQEGRQ